MTPRKKKKYLTDECRETEITDLGVVFCPSCKSKNVFNGASKTEEIATNMFSLNLLYVCTEKKCDRHFQINLIVTDPKAGDTYEQ